MIERACGFTQTARIGDGLALEVKAGRKRGQQWQDALQTPGDELATVRMTI
jgi:hypothetical protein